MHAESQEEREASLTDWLTDWLGDIPSSNIESIGRKGEDKGTFLLPASKTSALFRPTFSAALVLTLPTNV